MGSRGGRNGVELRLSVVWVGFPYLNQSFNHILSDTGGQVGLGCLQVFGQFVNCGGGRFL